MAKIMASLDNELFGHKVKLGLTDPDLTIGARKTGPTFTAVETRAALSESDVNAVATLSSAAFLIKALANNELSLAIAADDEMLYGEFRHTNKTTGKDEEWQFLCTPDLNLEVSYAGDAMDENSPYNILPYAAYKTFFCGNKELITTLCDAYKAVLAKDSTAEAKIFTFCDCFYMNKKHIFKDSNFSISDHSFSIAAIKEAVKMGNMFDMGDSNFYSMTFQTAWLYDEDVKLPKCQAFSDVASKKKGRKKTETKAKKSEDVWERTLRDIKSGKYLISYEWSESQISHIPPMSYLDTFIPSEEFYEILRKVEYRIGEHMSSAAMLGLTAPDDIKNDIVNILLYGDPGSGKTAMVHALAAATGMPLYSIKFNEDSEDDVFEGKNKIVDGKISFVGTEFLEGYENGGIILMEEINLGRANMLTSVMNQALEYPFYIEKNGYEQIHRHPLVVAFATMNLDTDGTMTLNSAMAQRFNNKYLINEPSANALKDRLIASGFPKERVEHVYGIYAKLRDYLKENSQRQKYLQELSIRQCIAALQDMEEGTSCARAVFNTMYGALCIKNRKLADAVKDAILDTYPDYVGE